MAEGAGNPPGGAFMSNDQLIQFTAQLLAGIQGNDGGHGGGIKPKEPEPFEGEPTKLRSFLANLQLIFNVQPRKYGTDNEKINYAQTYFRGKALNWLVPIIEERIPAPWTNYATFKEALQDTFGDKQAKERAANAMDKIKQGARAFSEYWSDFRLLMTEVDYTDEGYLRYLLKGTSNELLDCYQNQGAEFATPATFANWAIRQEAKIQSIRQMKGINQRSYEPRNNPTPRPPQNRPLTTSQGGDAMDYDANRYPRTPKIEKEEYNRRKKEGLCLKCGRRGHMIRDCRSKTNPARVSVAEMEHLNEEGPEDAADC